MAPKKRKPRTVVTEATKAKLPRPKRKRPKKETWAEGHAKWEAKGRNPALDTDKHGTFHPKPNVEYDMGTFPAPRAIPCAGDTPSVIAVDWPWGGTITRAGWSQPFPSPIAEQNPWPVRVLNWLDEAPTKARRRIAAWLRALAGRVDA